MYRLSMIIDEYDRRLDVGTNLITKVVKNPADGRMYENSNTSGAHTYMFYEQN